VALLEYTNRTVPDVVKKAVPSFYSRDPYLKRLRSNGMVKRSGGTNVRVVRIKSGHSDEVQIDATNISVPLNKKETLSNMTGDWGKVIKPIILPHISLDRMSSKDEVKRYINDMSTAAMSGLMNRVCRQLYLGNVATLTQLGTLSGNVTGLTSTGFENGALRFQTPTAQAAAAVTYLGETRVEDTTNFEDNWYNQFVAHNGFGTDFLQTAEEVKITADSFCEDETGISLGVLSIADHVQLSEEVRTYPGGGGVSAINYTVDDIKAGKSHPTVVMAGGVQYFANRWMTDALVGSTDACYLLNPLGCEWWVNANNDFRVTEFTDHLKTSNQDADIGYIILEVQSAVPNLLISGCTSQ